MEPRAILLDLDDTILSYSASSDGCWEELCVRYAPRLGVGFSDLVEALRANREWFWSDRERSHTGRLDMRDARRRIVARTFDQLGLAREALGTELADTFTRLREERIDFFPGALQALERLRDRGIRLGLLTNGSAEFQRAKVERFTLEPYFGWIQIEGEQGFGKPEPRAFRHALDRLGASPGESWMVGDNLAHDIAPAQALGLHGVWVDHEARGLPDGSPVEPHRTVQALAELL